MIKTENRLYITGAILTKNDRAEVLNDAKNWYEANKPYKPFKL